MSYYFTKKVDMAFDEAVEYVTQELKKEGFGILTEIDVKATFRKKLDVDFRPYKILGACHPPSAHQALLAEDKVGLMLPCNVIVQQKNDGVEIAAVDPIASMAAIENPGLGGVAKEVQAKMKKVIDSL